MKDLVEIVDLFIKNTKLQITPSFFFSFFFFFEIQFNLVTFDLFIQFNLYFYRGAYLAQLCIALQEIDINQ